VFLARVATQGLVILTVTMLGLGFPYSPTQVGLTLFTVGLPTVFLTAWARPAPPDPHLLATIGRFVVPAALATAGCGVAVYTILYRLVAGGFEDGSTPPAVITEFEGYTGLTYGEDAGFAEAAATLGAQTGLSTFVSLASILLILFLHPPARLFAAWTDPTSDKRPAVLVVVLLAVLLGVLFTPVLSDYFGLTGPAGAVYETVLPALVGWFLVLSAAYRFRLVDRVLGLRHHR
jgi:cation-transporting ATPase E